MPKIGEAIVYVDEYSNAHAAIVTQNWGNASDPGVALNLVYVVDEEDKTDQYGRQIKRQTSVVPEKKQTAPGRYYKVV